MRLRNLLYKEATVQRFKRNQKEARVHFIPNLKNRVFVTLCAPVVINYKLSSTTNCRIHDKENSMLLSMTLRTHCTNTL